MKIINLLPKSAQKELQLQQQAEILKQFWVSVSLVLLVLFLMSFAAEFMLKQNTIAVESEIIDLRRELSTAANQKLDDEVKALNTQIKTLNTLQSQHYYWSNALVELSRVMPTDLSVDFLTLDRSNGKVEIAGKGGSRISVLLLWANIKRTKMFKDINFPLTNLEKSEDGAFTYVFYINPDEVKKE
jgi:Tfp pilus assembly protein PilN